MTVLGERGLGQTFNLSNVTVFEGSTQITFDITGPVDGTIPALNMVMGGTFTAAPPAPALPPWMLGLFALLLVGATVWVVRRRRSGPGVSSSR